MKIAILQSPTFPLNMDFHGGIEAVELGELDALNRLGHQARMFVPQLIGKKKEVEVIRDLGYRNRLAKWFYYLVFLFKVRRWDIRHGHYTPILHTLCPEGSIVHFHGLSISELPLYRHSFFRRRYKKAHYIFCSEWVKEEFSGMYPDIPSGNLHVVYNAVDIRNFAERRRAGQKSFTNICWYGLWEEEKGIFQLLKAIRLLEDKRKDFRVAIGGSASFEGHNPDSKEIDSAVRAAAARLKTTRLVGCIKRGDLADFLYGQDIGIFPSIYKEPFPLVPIEMMAAGLPVIAYDVGGLKEMVVNGETGFLVDNRRPEKLAEMIEYFLDNRDEIRRMGKAARKHVEEKFTWDRHVEQLMEVYGKTGNAQRAGSDIRK